MSLVTLDTMLHNIWDRYLLKHMVLLPRGLWAGIQLRSALLVQGRAIFICVETQFSYISRWISHMHVGRVWVCDWVCLNPACIIPLIQSISGLSMYQIARKPSPPSVPQNPSNVINTERHPHLIMSKTSPDCLLMSLCLDNKSRLWVPHNHSLSKALLHLIFLLPSIEMKSVLTPPHTHTHTLHPVYLWGAWLFTVDRKHEKFVSVSMRMSF